jgi:hypothetical protein
MGWLVDGYASGGCSRLMRHHTKVAPVPHMICNHALGSPFQLTSAGATRVCAVLSRSCMQIVIWCDLCYCCGCAAADVQQRVQVKLKCGV